MSRTIQTHMTKVVIASIKPSDTLKLNLPTISRCKKVNNDENPDNIVIKSKLGKLIQVGKGIWKQDKN